MAGRLAVSADDVAAAIARAATARHPRARYQVGTLARALFALRRWLPAPAFDAFVRTQFPSPGRPGAAATAERQQLLTSAAETPPRWNSAVKKPR